MINKKKATFLICLFGLLLCTTQLLAAQEAVSVGFTSEEKAWLAKHHIVRARVGQAPPLHFFDGKFRGISVDYLNLIAKRAGFEVQYVTDIPWTNALDHIKNHETIDLILTAKKTKERRSFMGFTDDYLLIPWVIFTRKDSNPLGAIEELVGKTVSVEKTYVMHKNLAAEYPGIKLLVKNTSKEALEAVATGLADAYIGNLTTATYIIQQQNFTNLKVAAPTPFGNHNQAMAIRDDWPELAGIINKTIAAMAPEEHAAIRTKWGAIDYEQGVDKGKQTKVELTVKEREWLNAHPRIRVHNELNWPPFNFNEDGKPKGFSIAYIDLLARKLGLEVEYVSGPSWGEFLDMIKGKDLDVMLNIIKTDNRSKYINFTRPYVENPPGIVAREDNAEIKDFESLFGKTISIPSGFFYQELIERNYPDIKLLLLKNQTECLKAVAFGKADATIGGITIQNYLIRQNMLNNLKVIGGLPEEIFANRLRLGVRDDWPELAIILGKAIASVSEQEYAGLSDQWIPTGKADKEDDWLKTHPLTDDEVAFLKQHPVIRVHNEMKWPPFNFNDNGLPAGYSIDYMNLLADKLGIKVEYVSGPTWNDFLGMIKSKDLDVMLNIVNTEDRRKYIIFTDKYLRTLTGIYVKAAGQRFSSLAELDGRRLALPIGFFEQELLEKHYPNINLHLVKNNLEALEAVATGKADAAIGEMGVMSYIMAEHSIMDIVLTGTIKDQRFDNVLNLGVRKDWPILRDILQKAMNAVSFEQKRALQNKWVVSDKTDPEQDQMAFTAAEKVWLKEHPLLRLGVDPSWAPFEYFDFEGKLAGITSDNIRILTEKLGTVIEPVKGLTWGEVLEQAKKGEIDIISSVAKIEERTEYLLFTKPYIHLPMVVVMRDDAPLIEDIQNLKDKTIAVVKGYAIHSYLKRDYPEQQLLMFDNLADAMKAVAEGKADAVIENVTSINFAKNELGLTNLNVVAPTPYAYDLSFGVRKDWPQLIPILEKGLAAITDREKEIIKDKWVNIRFKKQIDWQMVLGIILIGTFVVGIILSVILIWNRRLAGEIAERKQKEKLIMIGAQISQSLTVGDTLKETLQSIADIFVKELNVAFARIWIVDETENVLKLQASSGLYSHIDGAHERMSMGGDTKIGRVVFEQQPHISNSIQDDPYVKDKDWAREQRLTSYAGIPMVVEGRSIGALVVFSRDAIQEDTSRTLLSIAGSIAVATERNRAEETILASERKIRGMSESSLDAMIMIDGKANIIFWNPAAERIFGYSAEEVMSRNLHDLVLPPEDRELAYKGIDEFIQTGKGKVIGVVIEHKALRKDGSMFPAEIAVSALQMDNEWYAVGTVRDITDRKKAEEELQQNLEDLERFSYMATGREEKMIQLKAEINELLIQSGKGKKYKIVQ